MAEYRIPPVGTTNPSGTSNALINSFTRYAGSVPGLSAPVNWLMGLHKSATDGAKRLATERRVQDAINLMKTLKDRTVTSVDQPKTIPIESSMLARLGGLAVAADVGSLY